MFHLDNAEVNISSSNIKVVIQGQDHRSWIIVVKQHYK